jgi:hypothetical protein
MITQYKGSAKGGIPIGYLVYAWIGNPLLGKVRGTERTFKLSEKRKAETYAKNLRKVAKDWH